MSIICKINILEELKEKGYNTYRIRNENIISEGTLSSFRKGNIMTLANLDKLCKLLECDIMDIIEYRKEQE